MANMKREISSNLGVTLTVVVSGGLIPEPEQRAVYVMITRACRLEVSPGFNPQEVRSLWEILRSIEEQPIHSQP
jgi:hypothetical protein